MKRIRLSLTGVGNVLTESAEKKLEKGESYKTPTCDNGKTASWYEDMNIPIPDELELKLKQQDEGVKLEDGDFEEVYSDVSIYEDDILLKVTDEDFTTIFVRGGDVTLTVLETVDEIDSYIEYMNRGWFERIKDYVSFFFAAKFKKQK